MDCNGTGHCRRCEDYSSIPSVGDLYLWYPTQHFLSKLQTALIEYSSTVHVDSDCIVIKAMSARQVSSALGAQFNDLELQDFKALFLPVGETPSVRNLRNIQNLKSLIQKAENRWLPELLSESRITSYFQPIVRVDEPESIFAYEALLRGEKEGEIVTAGSILDAARGCDMLFQVDREARLSAIRTASELAIKEKVFVNFLPAAIYDPKTCLRTTEREIERSGLTAEQVVFEVVETERVTNASHLLNILQHYRERGFKIALDDLGAGFSSLNLMNKLRPDYIKLDMELVREVQQDSFKAVVLGRLLDMGKALGIETIAEGVETPEEFDWLARNGATYAQGYLFARPAPVPPQVAPAATVRPQSTFSGAQGSGPPGRPQEKVS